MGELLPQRRGHVLPSQGVVKTLDIALQFHLPNTATNRLLQATTTQKSSAVEGKRKRGREGGSKGEREGERGIESVTNTSIIMYYDREPHSVMFNVVAKQWNHTLCVRVP